MEVFLTRGMVQSLPVRLTSPGVWKTRVLLRVASVMITFKLGVWRTCVVPLQATTPSGIRWSIGVVMIRMVWLINNFCGEFPLVVSVSVTFLFFPSLV